MVLLNDSMMELYTTVYRLYNVKVIFAVKNCYYYVERMYAMFNLGLPIFEF